MQKPYISVILIAHFKREFLTVAIESVLNQTLKKEHYEFILVKGFKDKELEKFCKKNNILATTTNGPMTIGENLHLGVSKSKGDIICFLEDDDLFNEEKLKTIYDTFKANQELVYYHNAYDIINSEGKIFPGLGPENPITVNRPEELNKKLPELISVDASGNVSSISIRKSLMGNNINELLNKEIKNPTDCMIFFISTNTKKMLMADSKVLSYYRKHNVEVKEDKMMLHNKKTKEEFRASLSNACVNTIKSLEEIKRLVDNPTCKECLSYLIIYQKMISYLPDGGKASRLSIKEYLLYAKYLIYDKHKKNNILLLLLLLAAHIVPDMTLKFYYDYSMKKFK